MYLWWSVCTLYYMRMYLWWRGCTSGGVYVPCVYEDVPLVEFMYLVFMRMYLWLSLCTLYLHACQVRVTVGV